MKKLLIGLLALGSISAFAQTRSASDIFKSMRIIAKAHTESQGVQEIKKEIENKYEVRCKGSSTLPQAGFNKIAKYKGTCTGIWFNQKLELEIKSSFETEDRENLNFEVKSFKVIF